MLSLPPSVRIFVSREPVDMRKGFDSLAGLVRSEMRFNPVDGSVYVFLNNNRTLIKLLHWESGGFTLYYKRLEKGVFERPFMHDSDEVTWQDLMLMVSGIDLKTVRKKVRYLPVKK